MPTWTTLTERAVGHPITKEDNDAQIDDLNFLYNLLVSSIATRDIVLNGSFENDTDSDGIPDSWTRTLLTGGSFVRDESTTAADGKAMHGKWSAKFTSPGGSGNGGGTLEQTDYIEITPGRPMQVIWQMKSSVAGVANKVELVLYDSTKTLISSVTLYSSSSNPTAWTTFNITSAIHANARFAKIKLTGCDTTSTTAGSTWFDDIQVRTWSFDYRAEVNEAGKWKWVCPTGTNLVEVTLFGAGGGGSGSQLGGGSGNDAGRGGGGGGMCRGIFTVTPGTTYEFELGTGGLGNTTGGSGAANDGGDGTDSTITIGSITMTAGGGMGATAHGTGGAGGAGGTASGGTVNVTGTDGSAAHSASRGGDGGYCPEYGIAVNITGSGDSGDRDGRGYGAGGSGSGDDITPVAGDGSAGHIIFRW